MPKDRPDFTRPIAFLVQERGVSSRREWAAEIGELKTWFFMKAVPAGESTVVTIYQVPTGKRLFYASTISSSEVRGEHRYWSEFLGGLLWTLAPGHESRFFPNEVPILMEEGDIFKCTLINKDTTLGNIGGSINAFETGAGSKELSNPKSLLEKYKSGDFNYCQIFPSLEKEGRDVYIFTKTGEREFSVIEVDEFATDREKLVMEEKMPFTKLMDYLTIKGKKDFFLPRSWRS